MKTISALVMLGMFAIGCAQSGAEPKTVAGAGGCSAANDSELIGHVYSAGTIYAAKPIKKRVFLARANQPIRTFGAQLYMHAPKGVTKEYMERQLTCHAAAGGTVHPNDPLKPSAGAVADIDVRSAGGDFAIEVIGHDHHAGRDIWQRAQSISGGAGAVQVEQVGSASDPQATF